jgi:hypothetical protein
MSYFDDASLVMIPSGYKTSKVYSVKPTDGTGDLAFTRSNDTATRVGPDGLIEKVRTNLLLQSNTFTNAAWVKDGCTITAAYGTAPDGTQTASRAVFSAGDKTIYQLISATGVAGSLYVKGTAGQTIAFGIAGSESTFTLDGTWQRFTKSIAGSTSSIQLNTYGGVTARDVLIWSAQLEYGDIATDVIPTTSAAVSVGPVANVPRLDYLNSSCPRLLLEPQRTNLHAYSEQLVNTFIQAGTSVTSNTSISPSGYQDADTVTKTSGSGHLFVNTGGGDAGTIQTFSVYYKGTAGQSIVMNFLQGGSGTDAQKTVVFTGNWQRESITFTRGTSYNIYYLVDYRQGGTSTSFQAWGAQFETGAYATSYIPTLGAAVTRGADAASKTGISSLIGQTEGTMFLDADYIASTGSNYNTLLVLSPTGGLGSGYVVIDRYPDNTVVCEYNQGGIQAKIISATTYGNQRLKIAFAYKANDFVAYVNGVQIGTDNSGTTGLTLSELLMPYIPNAPFGGKIGQALLFKTRLTNAQLAELTTI